MFPSPHQGPHSPTSACYCFLSKAPCRFTAWILVLKKDSDLGTEKVDASSVRKAWAVGEWYWFVSFNPSSLWNALKWNLYVFPSLILIFFSLQFFPSQGIPVFWRSIKWQIRIFVLMLCETRVLPGRIACPCKITFFSVRYGV